MFVFRMISLPFLTLLLAISCEAEGLNTSEVWKPYKLALLSLMPLTGKEPSDAKACIAAAEIVIENVNRRRDILPDYHVAMTIKDEGPTAFSAPKQFVNFLRDFEDKSEKGSYLAPIVVGPSIACQSVAFTLRINHYTEFAEGCTGPYLIKMRNIYSTLYRTQMPWENLCMAIILFVEKIGHWKQVGIVSYYPNANDIMLGQLIHQQVTEHGIDVAYYTSEPDITDQVIQAIKESDARIIILAHSQLQLTLKFLCMTYIAKLRAPNFVIISNFYTYFTADSPFLVLPKGCSREMIYEQIKITFWTGSWLVAVENNGKTPLGYDLNWFEAKMMEKLNNSVKMPDYPQRHLCHDATMAAVMTLNASENWLNTMYNSSLRDFQEKPELVGKVTNFSAANLDFNGLRIGRLKYSERLELDSEDMWIVQWVDGSLNFNFKVSRNDTNYKTIPNISTYTLTPYQPPIWFTKSGKPPKDLSEILHLKDNLAESVTIGVVVSAGVLLIAQIILSVRIDLNRKRPNFIIFFNRTINLFTIVGFLILDIGSILLMFEIGFYEDALCFIRPLFPAVGFSLTNLSLLVRMCLLKILGGTNQAHLVRVVPNRRSVRTAEASIWLVLALFLAIILSWLFGIDPLIASYNRSPVSFNEDLQGYFDVETVECTSKYQVIWLSVLLAANALFLTGACFVSYEASKTIDTNSFFNVECRLLRLAIVNATTVFSAIVLITLITGDQQGQVVVVAVGNLVFSASTCALLFYPVWSNRWPDIEDVRKLSSAVPLGRMNALQVALPLRRFHFSMGHQAASVIRSAK